MKLTELGASAGIPVRQRPGQCQPESVAANVDWPVPAGDVGRPAVGSEGPRRPAKS